MVVVANHLSNQLAYHTGLYAKQKGYKMVSFLEGLNVDICSLVTNRNRRELELDLE